MQFKGTPFTLEVLTLDVLAGVLLYMDLDKTLIIGEILVAFTASVYTLFRITDWLLKKRKQWILKKRKQWILKNREDEN